MIGDKSVKKLFVKKMPTCHSVPAACEITCRCRSVGLAETSLCKWTVPKHLCICDIFIKHEVMNLVDL